MKQLQRVVIGLLLWIPSALQAATFYSVDVSTSRLKIVSSSGQVTDVGALGLTVTDVDLAMLNGHLYAIDSVVGSHVDLLEINRNTGAAMRLGTVAEGPQTAKGAEALAVKNNQLWIGYAFDSSERSPRLGILNLDGSIDSATAVNTNVDLDAMAWNGSEWRVIDARYPDSDKATLFGGTGPSFVAKVTGSYADLGINDLQYQDGSLWGMRADSRLVQLNENTGEILTAVRIGTGDIYGSLAPVPEPASLSVIASAGLVLLKRQRRRDVGLRLH